MFHLGHTPVVAGSQVDGRAEIDSSYSHHEEILDEALMESFPASDSIAIRFDYIALPRSLGMVKTSKAPARA